MISGDVKRAIAATEAFVSVLNAEDFPGWAKRFTQIAAYLKDGDIKGALHSYKNTSYAGPGSLSDIYARDQAAFDRAWGQCSVSLKALGKA